MLGKRQAVAPLAISQEERLFLDRVALHSNETVTEVAKALSFSGSKAARIRNLLAEKGLLLEVETRLGRERTLAKFAVPTLSGFRILGREPHHGRGGPIHRYFQRLISDWAQAQGYVVDVEHPVGDGSVDVHLEQESIATAVELSVTSSAERELENMKKCFAAGYQRVIVLFLDNEERKTAEVLAKSNFSKEEIDRVSFGTLDRFDELI